MIVIADPFDVLSAALARAEFAGEVYSAASALEAIRFNLTQAESEVRTLTNDLRSRYEALQLERQRCAALEAELEAERKAHALTKALGDGFSSALMAAEAELEKLRAPVQWVQVCGCEWGNGEAPAGAVSLGNIDDGTAMVGPKQWIKPCELHERYGHHREMSGFDEGISK